MANSLGIDPTLRKFYSSNGLLNTKPVYGIGMLQWTKTYGWKTYNWWTHVVPEYHLGIWPESIEEATFIRAYPQEDYYIPMFLSGLDTSAYKSLAFEDFEVHSFPISMEIQ